MARTNKVLKSYVNRIIEVRRVIIPAAQKEALVLGDKLDAGTYRTSDFPGLKLQVSEEKVFNRVVAWKEVAWQLAAAYNIPEYMVLRFANENQKAVHPSGHNKTSVAADKVKNPGLKSILL